MNKENIKPIEYIYIYSFILLCYKMLGRIKEFCKEYLVQEKL